MAKTSARSRRPHGPPRLCFVARRQLAPRYRDQHPVRGCQRSRRRSGANRQSSRRSPMGCSPSLSARNRTAMTSIGLHRASGGLWHAFECRRAEVKRPQPLDGKGKAPPPDGRIWLVGLSFWRLPSSRRLALHLETCNNFNAPSRRRRARRADLRAMIRRDEDFRVRPGRIRDASAGARRPKSFVGEVMRAAKKAGHIGQSFRPQRRLARAARDSGAAGAPPSRCRCRRPRGGS